MDFSQYIAAEHGVKVFCFPRGVTLGQIQAVVVKGLRDNPNTLHMAAMWLTVGHLKTAFPCPQNSN